MVLYNFRVRGHQLSRYRNSAAMVRPAPTENLPNLALKYLAKTSTFAAKDRLAVIDARESRAKTPNAVQPQKVFPKRRDRRFLWN